MLKRRSKFDSSNAWKQIPLTHCVMWMISCAFTSFNTHMLSLDDCSSSFPFIEARLEENDLILLRDVLKICILLHGWAKTRSRKSKFHNLSLKVGCVKRWNHGCQLFAEDKTLNGWCSSKGSETSNTTSFLSISISQLMLTPFRLVPSYTLSKMWALRLSQPWAPICRSRFCLPQLE